MQLLRPLCLFALTAALTTAEEDAQGDCKTQTVVSGDSCGALASRCGITGNQLSQYNTAKDFCATLTPGQLVCCSSGNLPDLRPKPGSDGTCAVYTVQPGDYCAIIASKHSLKPEDIEKFNNLTTWGWSGCSYLQAQQNICLSSGRPPMPAPIPNSVCGPVKPGTIPIADGENTTYAELNPCPLNACCNIWGQCGLTKDYCTAELGPSGNPGTAPPGKNGCISNCGMDIKKSSPPNSFQKVAYYESWNWDRSCLNMRVRDMDLADYTHAHWAFAALDNGMNVIIDDKYNQFPAFLNLTVPKKIVSFGGWGFSTDPATYEVLRNAMAPANRDKFASNVVSFIVNNNLDGVDFDWEYPGAPDIPGIPPGLASDAPDYLEFLKLLRGKIPQGKTISIAAPASYWYLKQFPIAEMAKSLDYIVYMTYDLHGQWDYGNKWASEGCPAGNCLRSHVNLTETMQALAMITKAGVPSNMVTVGVSSYGRSFGMLEAGCSGPMCPYGGPASTAKPGRCTVTGGYISNAEIAEIIASTTAPSATLFDDDSDSDILVYANDQWVAYMSDITKARRIDTYKSLGFGGTVDWAIDLQQFGDDDGDPTDDDDDENLGPDTPIPDCDANFATLEDLDAAIGSIPEECQAKYLATTLQNVLASSVNQYHDIMAKGYDGKFQTYAQSISDNAGSTVRDFVNKHGDQYFTCVVGEMTTCCDYCNSHYPAKNCQYCFDGDCYKTCSNIAGCPPDKRSAFEGMDEAVVRAQMGRNDTIMGGMKAVKLLGQADAMLASEDDGPVSPHKPVIRDSPGTHKEPITKNIKVSEPCPPDRSKHGLGDGSIWWTLRDDQADKFYADLYTDTGIAKNKIKFDTYDRGDHCNPGAPVDAECWWFDMDFGMATPIGYGVNDVLNPKSVVEKALDNSNNLASQLADAVADLMADCYYGDPFELIDTLSIPVLTIAQAVDNMAQVEEVADKIDEAKKKAMILAFVSAILFFIPVVGEVAGAVAELGDIAAITALIGAAGNAAMDVYTIVDDPSNAPLAIFSLILAPLALADIAKIAQAANLRRAMTDADVAKLGAKVSGRLGTVRKITGVCRRVKY